MKVQTEKPSYQLVKEKIEKMIDNGEVKVGEKFPSEIQMAKKFSVSRETFRSAVKLLESEGRVYVKHGVGTFITSPLPFIENSLEKLTRIGQLIQLAGLIEGEQKEFFDIVPATKEWAEYLSIQEGDLVVHHERIRTANGEPVVCSLNIMPKSIVGDTFEQKELTGSLTLFLEKECNIKFMRSDTELEVPLHIDRYCQKLLIHPQTTVMLLKQLHYDELNRPVMFSYDYLRNDIFKFRVRRTR
ncbi:GntR family transcriptional regulator [Alkalihalobacillus sp. LMS39]|uniref:GntR family transcriptional regulator n=1 Tax=Alkalihalobacillus sp. LMS39 TaxID=2924032 RepID=UPI001FB460AF|nr:GntR family transcriptional regulator [Alkalihalobacillus sp. LMS39]UOE94822.1 GntR family transcriptional regulator [Alkalihalobacillus sp. LMS39]